MSESITHKTVVRPDFTRITDGRVAPNLIDAAKTWSACVNEHPNVVDKQIFWTPDTIGQLKGDCLTCFVPSVDTDVVLRVTDAVYSNRFRSAYVISDAALPKKLLDIPIVGKAVGEIPIIVISHEHIDQHFFDPHLQYHELEKVRDRFQSLATSLIETVA